MFFSVIKKIFLFYCNFHIRLFRGHIRKLLSISLNMMNYIWALICIFSLFTAIFTGNTGELSKGMPASANSAVETALKLLGTMSLWNGITEIMKESGLEEKIQKLFSPLISLIFPSYKGTDVISAVTANITANLLGLGNAATPLGIEAVRRMKEASGSDTADDETVRFVVINTAALTLIPTTVASLRQAAGSESPFSIIIPVWCTGLTALTAGLIAEKIFSKGWKK